MKNHRFLLAAAAIVLSFSACSSTPKVDVTTVDALGESEYWGAKDVQKVCVYMISDALSFPSIDNFIQQYKKSHGGEIPSVVVGRFRNVSSEPIDTTILSGIIRTAILRDGKLAFVEGGAAREDVRQERQEQQDYSSEESAAQLGKEIGADLILQGTVNSISTQAGKVITRTYYVSASMVNVETTRLIWESDSANPEYQVVKRITKKGVKP
jgi:PBP1b-binding outer membrane lipoprotein LpoB